MSADLSPEAVQRMLEIAEKATPGPWTAEKPSRDREGWSNGIIIAAVARGQGVYANPPGGSFPAADQSHIATFDPPTVRALLEEIVRLRALKLRPVGPTVPTIGTLVSHRNRSLPQDPPEEK